MTIRFHKKDVSLVPPLPADVLTCVDVTLVLKGTMTYAVNGAPAVLHAGDAVVYQPGDVRERSEGRETEYWSFNVTPDPEDRFPVFRGVIRRCVTEEVRLILELVSRISTNPSPSTETMLAHTFSLLYYALYEQSNTAEESGVVPRIKDYIEAHLSEPLSLLRISTQVYLSPNYCNSLFRGQTGETITSYVIRLRMERARDWILNTDRPLTDISASLGYAHYSYFSKLFKKKMKISPAKLRQTHIYSSKEQES